MPFEDEVCLRTRAPVQRDAHAEVVEFVYAAGFGMRDVNTGEPGERRQRVPAGFVVQTHWRDRRSETCREGKISWDSRISDLDPDFGMYECAQLKPGVKMVSGIFCEPFYEEVVDFFASPQGGKLCLLCDPARTNKE